MASEPTLREPSLSTSTGIWLTMWRILSVAGAKFSSYFPNYASQEQPYVFYVHVSVHRNKFLYNKTNQMHQFPRFTPAWNSTCFGQFLCPSSGVYSLCIRHWYMSYKFVDSFRTGPSWSCSWQNKFLKLVHLFGFITKKFIILRWLCNLLIALYNSVTILPHVDNFYDYGHLSHETVIVQNNMWL